jgi:hypothetical protein
MIVNTPSIFKIKRLVKIIKISNIFSFLFVACCLTLAARCLAALQVRWRQVPVIIGEPGQQVIVFYFSFHIILSFWVK